MDQPLIQEQIDYYRKRAPEYDETSSPSDSPLLGHRRTIEAAFHEFQPRGRVLEIASGTGTWTQHLLPHASSVVALDSSHEMHDAARRKIHNDDRVRYIDADVFSSNPEGSFDVVFFANWLSHIPPTRFDRFWGIVREAWLPTVAFSSSTRSRTRWRNEELREEFEAEPSVPIVRRTLQSGGTFRVVKVFWEPAELETSLHALGWDSEVHTAGPLYWGTARRAARSE